MEKHTSGKNINMISNISASRSKPKLLPIQVYFKENLRKFLAETSLNGLKYVEDVHRNILERSYYLISFSIVFTAGLYMGLYFLQKWENTPVLIGISPKSTSVTNIPFPSATFCNMNQALASKVKDIQPGTPEYGMLQSICFQDYNYSSYRNLKPRSENDRLIDFKLKVSQNCTDMIIYCKFGRHIEPCSNLFRDVYLDEGICCVFNRLHPFFIFKRKTEFIRDYTSVSGRSNIPVRWSLEKGYGKKLPKMYYPRKGVGAGPSLGLTVVLKANIDEYYCSSTNGAGFKVALYNPLDSPHIRQTGLPISLGHETRMRINTKIVESQHALRNIKPNDRQCYFSNEKKLSFYKYYTRRSCETECEAEQMLHYCQCIPYHMPNIYGNSSLCYLSDVDCIVRVEHLSLDPYILDCKKKCWPGCYDLLYYPDMFVTPLAKRDLSLRNPFFHNFTKNTIIKDLAVVYIYNRNTHFQGYTKVPYTQFADFLSQTGGIMSLMVGFSVISIVEVLYFILLKPFFDMILKRNPLALEGHCDEVENDNFVGDKFHHQMLFKRRKNINNRVMYWDKKILQNYRNDKY